MDYDAIILGAGPAGSTTALLLARAGWSVAIVEKDAFPRRKVCGEFMSATNAPLFALLGVEGVVRERAGPEISRVGLFSGADVIEAAMPSFSGRSARWGRALGRDVLDTALLAEAVAAGAVSWQPWKATALASGTTGHLCTIARGSEGRVLRARIIIAAHGSWSPGGLPTQMAREHRPTDLLAFKARFLNSGLAPDLMPLLVFPGGYGGMVCSDGARASLSCCIRRDWLNIARARHPDAPAGEAVLRHIEASCRGVADVLEAAVLDGTWLSAGPIRPGIRERHADGVFRVGNVAGEAHPIVAEGISMAMQSGWLLSSVLLAGEARDLEPGALDAVGRDYGGRWARLFAPRIRAAAAFAALALEPRAAAHARPLLKRFPTLLSLGARLSGKTMSAECHIHHALPADHDLRPARRC
jgi:flavin-dependent dehydrogenase